MTEEIKIISPEEVDQFVEEILNIIDSEYLEELIPVIPIENGELNDCFGNVDKKIEKDGGKRHYGWVIWKSKILYEAEFHAVWENERGALIDVSPHEFDYKRIMFVSKNNYPYNGQYVDNIRINYTKNPLVDDFIRLSEVINKMYNFGEKGEANTIILPENILKVIRDLDFFKRGVQILIYQGKTIKSKCFCDSGKNYKNCHGKELSYQLKKVLKEVTKMNKN